MANLHTYKRLLKQVRATPGGDAAISMLPQLYSYDAICHAADHVKTGELISSLGPSGFTLLERLLCELRQLADEDDYFNGMTSMPNIFPEESREEWLNGIQKSRDGDLSTFVALNRLLAGVSISKARQTTRSEVRGFVRCGAELLEPALREARRLLMQVHINNVTSHSNGIENNVSDSAPRRRRVGV